MSLLLKRRFKKESEKHPLSPSMTVNVKTIQSIIGQSEDVTVRHFSLGKEPKIGATILYLDGLADLSIINSLLAQTVLFPEGKQHTLPDLIKFFEKSGDVTVHTSIDEAVKALLNGLSLIFIEEQDCILAVEMLFTQERQVDIPTTENVIRGPKEAFVENLYVNMSLVRRRIKDPHLRFDSWTFGERSQTKVMVTYISDVINPIILTELESRLQRINTDAIQSSGDLEELIEDEFFTPFPTVYSSERPDVITSHLLEGKIALLIDGSPFPLVVPAPFVEFIHSAEDYTQRADIGTLIRLLRFACIFVALFTPSIYVAVTTFHQELIPFNLMVSLAAQSEGTPFPTVVEVLIMELLFEIIREASIRMPLPVGQALAIVGALVIGTAVVEAGIISSTVVIVVALTAISSFVFPTYSIGVPFRICRFIVLLFASVYGLFGIFLFGMILLLHLSNLKSYGVPYLEGMSPFIRREQGDAIFRLPKWLLNTRPRSYHKIEQSVKKHPNRQNVCRSDQSCVS